MGGSGSRKKLSSGDPWTEGTLTFAFVVRDQLPGRPKELMTQESEHTLLLGDSDDEMEGLWTEVFRKLGLVCAGMVALVLVAISF